MSSSSFQQARLAEQLRLSKQQTQNEGIVSEMTSQEESSSSAAATSSSDDDDDTSSSSLDATEEARNILELENEVLGPDGMPFAPMVTYQKYLTMQEKRVKVTIRYSAEAGLRPLYLTVANEIKSTYPDVLLEKRILPPVGSDAGGNEAIFEVVVDGKTVVGKKKTKMLKVVSRSSRKNDGNDDGKGDDGKSEGGNSKSGNGETNTPDIAGGRSIFVSMEKLDYEVIKARKRRRPNTMYKSKEIATGTIVEGSQLEGSGNNVVQSAGMTEAVIRLERLKAMNTRSKI